MKTPAQQYLPFLEKILSPHRLQHSLGVMQVMGELAEVYDLDRDHAQTIGILHDAAKDLHPEQYDQLVTEGNIEIRYECDSNYNFYLHGPVGAYFVQKELGITDQLTLDAIAMHTFAKTGENFHHPMVWCMRFSDILEPNRKWTDIKTLQDNVDHLKELVHAHQMIAGALLHLTCLIDWMDEVGIAVHPNMRQTQKEYAVQLKNGDSHEIK